MIKYLCFKSVYNPDITLVVPEEAFPEIASTFKRFKPEGKVIMANNETEAIAKFNEPSEAMQDSNYREADNDAVVCAQCIYSKIDELSMLNCAWSRYGTIYVLKNFTCDRAYPKGV